MKRWIIAAVLLILTASAITLAQTNTGTGGGAGYTGGSVANPFLAPDGSNGASGYGFTNCSNCGFFRDSNGTIQQTSGVENMIWGNSIINMSSIVILGWSSGGVDGVAADTNVSRASAGVIQAGTGSSANANGTFSAAHFTGGGSAGVTAGSFTAITAIQTTGGIVTTLTGTSDALLKTNIHPFVRGLDSVMKLHPSLYKWNEKGQEITKFPASLEQAGFVAQDVKKAIPEAVGSEPHDGTNYLTISDRPILATLVNAIQQQQKEINQLKKELAKQRN